MKTISKNIENEIIIKNSKFICKLIRLNNSNINSILEEIKQEHPKATHYCYGYIYDNIKHSSDDNEPSNTAGLPILNVLEKENINHIIAVVIRYFGGIKLGAGGLIRAYTKSVTEALKNVEYITLEKGYKISLEFDYSNEKNINYLLTNTNIINKQYDKNIYYEVLVNKEVLEKLEKYNPKILEETYIEKFN